MKRYLPSLLVAQFMIICSLHAQEQGNIKMKLNGFGDMVLGKPFGNLADSGSNRLFNQFGDPDFPHGMHNGLFIPGIDLINSVYLNDDITIQTELNLEGNRGGVGGEFECDLERLFIDYKASEGLGVQVGYIFTPIGYINRNLYSRAWLMNSIHFYQAVEPASGYVPNHFVGGTVYGTFPLPKEEGIKYIIGIGMPRPVSPTSDVFDTNQEGYQATALLEWVIPGFKDFRIGLSGFSNNVHTFNLINYGDTVLMSNPDASKLVLQENGFNPYINFSGKHFNILIEYDYIKMLGMKGEYPENAGTTTQAVSAELSLNCFINKKHLTPYIRYDVINLPNRGGPYYGIRKLGDDILTKVYTPGFNAVMTGISYDLTHFNRLKIEYIHHFAGPRQSNGIFLQTAFGF